DVVHEIEMELVVKCRVDRAGRARQQDRVAVRGRAYDRLGSDMAAGTRPILDHERLAEPLRQPMPHQAGEDVIGAAGSKADDDAHRSRWIGLRPRDPPTGRDRGSAHCQTQELAARKTHGVLLWHWRFSAMCGPAMSLARKIGNDGHAV